MFRTLLEKIIQNLSRHSLKSLRLRKLLDHLCFYTYTKDVFTEKLKP